MSFHKQYVDGLKLEPGETTLVAPSVFARSVLLPQTPGIGIEFIDDRGDVVYAATVPPRDRYFDLAAAALRATGGAITRPTAVSIIALTANVEYVQLRNLGDAPVNVRVSFFR